MSFGINGLIKSFIGISCFSGAYGDNLDNVAIIYDTLAYIAM